MTEKKKANIVIVGAESNARWYCKLVKESAQALFARNEISKESLDKIVQACDKKLAELEANESKDYSISYFGS